MHHMWEDVHVIWENSHLCSCIKRQRYSIYWQHFSVCHKICGCSLWFIKVAEHSLRALCNFHCMTRRSTHDGWEQQRCANTAIISFAACWFYMDYKVLKKVHSMLPVKSYVRAVCQKKSGLKEPSHFAGFSSLTWGPFKCSACILNQIKVAMSHWTR